MNIVVFDNSSGKAWKKSRRLFAALLPQVSTRMFIGSLPKRIIEQLMYDLRCVVNKKSQVSIFVENKDGYSGWEGHFFGSDRPTQLEDFFSSSKYIRQIKRATVKRKPKNKSNTNGRLEKGERRTGKVGREGLKS